MLYSIVMVKNGSPILAEAALKSIRLHLHPDEIIVVDNRFIYSKTGTRHAEGINKGIAETRNNLVLCLDHDVIVVNNELEKRMIETMKDPNVFCCAAHEYSNDSGNLTLLLPCMMLKKDMYYSNNQLFNCSGNPTYATCDEAHKRGQKLIKLDLEHYLFHLGGACRIHYYGLMQKWESQFNLWVKQYNLKDKFWDYVYDSGMSLFDHEWLTFDIIQDIHTAIQFNQPFSLIRLGDLSLRFLIGYIEQNPDFAHVSLKHSDLAFPNMESANEIGKELIEVLKDADYIDHPKLYRGYFHDLFNWRGTLSWADELYNKIGVSISSKKYCCSIQNYTIFSQDFELSLYDLVRDRKILYIGPYPELDRLNERKSLETKNLSYLPSPNGTPDERYNRTNTILNEIDVKDWDLILITGSIWGRIVAGRIRKLGGRVFDLGQGICFNPNNVFEVAVKPNKEKTYYKLLDTSYKLSGQPESELKNPLVKII